MKKVAIIANYRDSFSLSEEKKFSYSELTRIFRENGLDLRRVSMHSFDQKKGIFTDYVDVDEGGEFKIFHEEYKPDIIWNRSNEGQLHFHTILRKSGYDIFPSSYISSIAGDKYEMYCFLKEFQPYTLLLKDFFAYPELRKNLSDRVVLKPIRSNSGKGILFPTQIELLDKKQSYEGLESLFIVQEFLDFHEGVPGLVEGIHDVRLVYIGGEYSHAILRIPAKGSLKSNIGSGGMDYLVADEKIPKILFSIGEAIIQKLDLGNDNVFSLDFGYVRSLDKWILFELNHSPGLQTVSKDQDEVNLFHQTYFGDLARYFISCP